MPPESPMRDVVAATLLGSPRFVARMRVWLADRLPDHDVPAARQLRRSVDMDAISTAVCGVFGVSPEVLAERGRWGNDPRAAAIYLSQKLTGLPLGAIGERFGGVRGAAVSRPASRFRERLSREHGLAKEVGRCERALHKSKV